VSDKFGRGSVEQAAMPKWRPAAAAAPAGAFACGKDSDEQTSAPPALRNPSAEVPAVIVVKVHEAAGRLANIEPPRPLT
jgi:hypothetical protein